MDPANIPRKMPRQARSEALVEALLAALARVLSQRDLQAATTNEIAQQAGVSIGSLYQYFPNKQALLAALIQKRAQADIDQGLTALAESPDQALEEVARRFVAKLVSHHRHNLKLYRVLLRAVPSLGQSSFVRRQAALARAQFQHFLETRQAELRNLNTDIASFVLGVSIEATLHAAILERPELLEDPAFERSLVELCTRYLTPTPAP
jgi:AcrR family transcriptional regulator